MEEVKPLTRILWDQIAMAVVLVGGNWGDIQFVEVVFAWVPVEVGD